MLRASALVSNCPLYENRGRRGVYKVTPLVLIEEQLLSTNSYVKSWVCLTHVFTVSKSCQTPRDSFYIDLMKLFPQFYTVMIQYFFTMAFSFFYFFSFLFNNFHHHFYLLFFLENSHHVECVVLHLPNMKVSSCTVSLVATDEIWP